MSIQEIMKTICAQRKKQQQFNYLNLPSRLESQTDSPYLNSNITKLQLDMRRKAEVLQYNQGNTKTNQMTKKEKFTLLMNGKAQTVSKSYIIANTDVSSNESISLTCNNINLPITTPSSASGVPNDYLHNVNTLFMDPTVPLYNYINPVLTRSYGITNSPLDANILFYSNYTNVNTNNTISTTSKISTIEFTDATVNPNYLLSITDIPLALQIYGELDLIGSQVNNKDLKITISDISLNALYSNQFVSPNSTYTYETSFTDREYTVDISANVNNSGPNFSGSFFIGYLRISDILLYADPGYIYDFQLVITVTYDSAIPIGNRTTAINNINAYIVANVTADNLINNAPYNCKLTNSLPTPITLGVFNITAV
jgi:hypothetical protein